MKKEVKILAIIGVLVIIGAVVGASYYRKSQENAAVVTKTNSNSGDKSAAFMETLVRPDSPTLGAADAKVTLVEFLDPECESCAAFAPVVKKIMKDYDGKIRLVVRYMPLHPNSMPAATLLETAGEEGKYWQMMDYLMQKQPEWGTKHGPATTTQPDALALFQKYATEMGLDTAKYNAALKENRYQAKVLRDQKDGQMLGVRQTPTFFVNGRKLMRFGEQDLRALIEDELKK
jgi:protein-disulfide isomerase